MKIPEFKPSKKFLGEYDLPCLVAEIKNSDVPGLATQHIAQFKENPKMEIHLRAKEAGKISAWMQKLLDVLFAKDGLTAAVVEGIKELPSDNFDHFDGEEGRFIKKHGYAPYVFVKQVVIDEVARKVFMTIGDGDGMDVFAEHGGVILMQGVRWHFEDGDYYSDYTGSLEKHRIDPELAKRTQQKIKLDALFPPPAIDEPVEKDCSRIYGRWEVDLGETNKLLESLGAPPDPAPSLLRGYFYIFSETFMESSSGNKTISLERRGNWITIKNSKEQLWCDGQRLITSSLPAYSSCCVYRRVPRLKSEVFSLDKEVILPGIERARSVGSESSRVFIARHSGVDIVDQLQTKHLKYVRIRASLINAPNICGFAASGFNRVSGLNSSEDELSLFGLVHKMDSQGFGESSWAILSSSKTSKTPVAVLFQTATEELYVFNAGDPSATVYEVATVENESGIYWKQTKPTIPLPGKPVAAACDSETGYVYCSLEDNKIAVINAKTCSVFAVWPVAPGEGPFGLAVDFRFHRLFVSCANKQLLMLDGESGRVITSIPVGEGAGACLFDDSSRLLFSIAGDGTLTIAYLETPEKLTVLQTLQTEGASHCIAMEQTNRKILLLKKGLETGAALLVYAAQDEGKA